ncbi:MAG: hypothetical protein VX307_03365, partial [Chloroflexota bacterium]|nr:hypothetical protein [Chloroflexota bacterium]
MIDEDVFDTEDDCRPDNGVGDSGSDDGLFDLGLSIEVWKRSPKEGLVMLTCTIRPTPASLAARTSVLEFSTARSKETSPRENRTQ